ncbi:SpaA isopeptide-forming pilin-related protein [Enterococcus sp. AZ109]|uniref:SpaA isopeptide-forming pilin-related protein n=1 Tax=Enterococcus sp. AZ109 TaxID=2774634 RepID=UPI003F20AD40
MEKRNSSARFLYGFMTFLIFMQYLTPVLGIAKILDEPPLIEIQKAIATKEEGESFVTVEGTIQGSDETTSKEIAISKDVYFTEQNQQDLSGISGASYSVTLDKVIIQVPPESNGNFYMKLPLDSQSLLNKKNFNLLHGNQSLVVEVPEELNNKNDRLEKSERALVDATTNIEDNPLSANITSTEEQTVERITPEIKAEAPTEVNDIRTYFLEGTGTIITKAEMSYFDKNGVELTPPIPVDATVRLYYDWSIPEEVRTQINSGDYFAFQLPEGVIVSNLQEGDLANGDGEVYAHYSVDESGQVKIIFNDRVTQESNINGTFNFETEFNREHIDGPGNTTITFPEEDHLPPITIPIRPATETTISKKGSFDRTPNPTEVKWVVDFNQGMQVLTNPVITEQWPSGLTYESVAVYKLVMNLDGTIASVGELLTPDQYTVDNNGNVIIAGEVTDAYRLEYLTSIDDSAIPEDGGTVSFTNTATLTDDNDSDGIDARASVTNTYGKILEKNRVGYDTSNQEFAWEIKYNYGGKHISQNDAVITDTLSDNLEFIEDSLELHIITFDENGREIVGRKLNTPEEYTLTPNLDGKGFVIQFTDDITSAIKVTYKTDVTSIVTDPTQVNNQVEIGTGQQDESNGTAQQQNVIKNYGNVNYADGQIDWTIQVNRNKYHMENLVLTDTFSPVPGLTLGRTVESGYQLTIIDSNGKTLEIGTDYRLIQTFDNADNETGLKIEFLGDYNPTEESLTVRYTTNFDISLLDPNNPALDHFNNDVSADWVDDQGDERHSEDDSSFKPEVDYSLNAQKSGMYNAQNKHITWTVAVNLSRNPLSGAYLKDQIKENQDFITDSLNIYEAVTLPDGTVVKENDTPVNNQMSIVTPSGDNNQTLEIHFPDESQHTYLIEFETSVEGKVVESSTNYENVAEYYNNGDDREVIGEVSVKNGGSHVQKNGEQDPSAPDFVNWHLVINPAQSVLQNVQVTDHPSNNQIIDQNSVILYQTFIAEDGAVTPDRNNPLSEGIDYELSIATDNVTGEQVLVARFLHEITTAYFMEYRALISSSSTGNTDTVSNQVDIVGEGTREVQDTGGQDVTVGVNHSGGSATGTKGRISLRKTSADGATSLTGAHFQLWDTTKTVLLREGDVNENGMIIFGNLILGDYLLVETTAPEGHTIPDDLVQGRRIQITADTSVENSVPTDIVNYPNKVILTKTDEDQLGLVGAEFSLERKSALGMWQMQAGGPFITDAQGKLEINSLQPGQYRLTEVRAPMDFIINTTPIEFFVLRNGNNQIPTVNLNMVNYQGSAKLIKSDENQNPLSGAVFKVIDSDGNPVVENLTSNTNGEINVESLAPGEYRFVETAAPNGYILNEREYPFTIPARAIGQPNIVDVATAINYQGSAELVKQAEDGTGLSGAVFQIQDTAGMIVKDQLISDQAGKISISGLAPGTYRIVETQAPDGYLLNTLNKEFEIINSAIDEPSIVEIGEFFNYKGSVKIRKVDTSEAPLAGGEFTLFDNNLESLEITKTSGQDGWIQFDDLAPGTYYIQETKAPLLPDGSSYVVNPYMIKVEIAESAEGKPAVVNLGDFQNFKGKAQITKEGNGAPIGNAHFDLYLYNEQTGQEERLGEVISNEDGNIPLENLGAGSYKLVETQAAPGYILNTQPIYFVVDPELESGPIDSFSYTNYQSTVVGVKVDGDGLTSQDNQTLAGAQFQIYQQNEDGSRGNGPISFFDEENQATDTVLTKADGKLSIKGLDEGNYLLVETKAPANFVLNTSEIPFVITSSLGKPEVIDLGVINNYRGKIDIEKVDDSGKRLNGGSFVLSTTPDGENPISIFNQNGIEVEELHSVEGHIIAQGIIPGTYYLVETKAPKGFVLNTEPIEVVIPISSENFQELLVTEQLVNYQGTAELIKQDISGQNLSGAIFDVVDETHELIQEGLTSGDDGKIIAENLAPGNYQFIETKAPDGYIINTTPIDFTISDSAAGKPSVQLASNNFINYQGTAQLTKKNVQGERLAGAEFKVVTSEGIEVAKGLSSDYDGKVMVERLSPGDYQFIETKAPEGYIINEQPVAFSISKESFGEPTVVLASDEFINYKGSAELTKVNAQNQPLQGAKFNVTNHAGDIVEKALESDSQGKVTIDHLQPGTYFFNETKAPDGYTLSNQQIEFTINESAKGVPARVDVGKFLNVKKSEIVPPSDSHTKTPPSVLSKLIPQLNDRNNQILMLIGILLVTAGLILWKERKKSN